MDPVLPDTLPTPRLRPPPARGRGAVALLIATLAGTPLAAQAPTCASHRPAHCTAEVPHAGGPARSEAHLRVLGVNAALGGVTAGVRQHARGGSFWKGFLHGAAGGGAVYAGKWISAEGFWGAGLAGRQVAALGAAAIRNASEGEPPLGRLMLPLGPVRLHLDRADERPVRLRLDALGAGILAHRALSPDTRFDLGASVSAGAPVFHTEVTRRAGWHGNNAAGVILLLDPAADPASTSIPVDRVLAHERIHTLQYDQAHHTVGAPVEGWLLGRLPGGRWLERHVDLGIVALPLLLGNALVPYENRPWEWEADFFSGTDHIRLDRPRPRPGI